MGATSFYTKAKGNTAQEAFDAAARDARCEYGNSGHTGTIADKESFVDLGVCPEMLAARDYAELILRKNDEVSDKWGPAGCIKIKDGQYMFFGYSPE